MPWEKVSTDRAEFKEAIDAVNSRKANPFHQGKRKRLTNSTANSVLPCGEFCGMSRNEAGLKKAKAKIQPLKQILEQRQCTGRCRRLNQELEKAGRVADFIGVRRTHGR